MIKIKIEKKLNLENTLTCGQIFRFYKQDDGSFNVVLDDRVINISETGNYIYVTSNNEQGLEEKIIRYLDLDTDYENILEELLNKDKKIKSAVEFSYGLKMIQQPHFETIMEYIISANNSVPSIANAINNISKKYGKKVTFRGEEYYLFPSISDLKDVTIEQYRECKVGFRDKYLYEIVQKLNKKEFDLDKINSLNTEDALNYLMTNNGIGPKIASCILLFSYKRYDVFPIDTWVKKIMKERYNLLNEKEIRNFSKKIYGEYCGLAIQYLFNESRNKN